MHLVIRPVAQYSSTNRVSVCASFFLVCLEKQGFFKFTLLTMATIGTFNEEGVNVDLYIPRKCHATNHLITSFDHSAVQISIANVDANGVIDGTTTTLCIAGYLRGQGESDHAINHLAISKGMIRIKTGKKPRAKKVKTVKGAAGRGAAKAAPQQKGARAAPGQKGA
ncbi:putative 40S ribosomal protein S21, partial [Trypanosoma grayi]|uniref:putative 40S ribosomal protein S21 n=1 Tax=Trypanosoma grayi TaxID=71804 RepID=UPI0004F4912F